MQVKFKGINLRAQRCQRIHVGDHAAGHGDMHLDHRAVCVDKFDIPMVKVTGGQRIDLLGIEKEDLPAVWADLEDADRLFETVKTSGLKYMLCETSCYHADLYGLRRSSDAGGFGITYQTS